MYPLRDFWFLIFVLVLGLNTFLLFSCNNHDLHQCNLIVIFATLFLSYAFIIFQYPWHGIGYHFFDELLSLLFH